MKKLFILLTALAIVMGFSVQAHASLINLGTDTLDNRLIYDTDRDITWYDYRHYDYGSSSWGEQVIWADGLLVNFSGTLYDDWRLPRIIDIGNDGCNFGYSGTDCGYNVDTSTSEMAHLFYDELGNLAAYNTSGNPQVGWGLGNTGPFNDLRPYHYWSGTEYAPNTGRAWKFSFSNGRQHDYYKSSQYYAMAVHPGNLSTQPPIPEPITLSLLGSGLLGLVGLRKKRKKQQYPAA